MTKSELIARLAERYPQIVATVGVHPHDAAKVTPDTFDHLKTLGRHPKVVAFGEIGLDYHYDNSPREAQEQGFRQHIAAARETKLPLVIHSREADDDMARILREETGKGAFPAVLHCFTAGRDLGALPPTPEHLRTLTRPPRRGKDVNKSEE